VFAHGVTRRGIVGAHFEVKRSVPIIGAGADF
jgi:hypothetical protein